MKNLFISLSLIGVFFSSYSQNHSFSGKVIENNTGESVIGATIMLLNTDFNTATGLDGSFIIRNIPQGTYDVEIRFITFETINQKITIDQNVKIDFKIKESSLLLGDVEIIATRDESSEYSARMSEMKEMKVLNVISSKEIEVSPDITVANVLQRVSGVSLERNSNGDGQFAIVRGMDKRYNYTLVNGIKVPSPDPRNRYVPLDIFPSDLIDRLEVTKALTPNMEGDAIGGVIDMKMKSAPDRLTVNFNAGTGYNQLYFDNKYRSFDRSATSMESPRIANGKDYQATVDDFPLNSVDFQNTQPPINQIYGLSVGNRFFKNKLGVLVAGSYQNTYRGANSLFMNTFIDQATNTPYYEIVENRQFSAQQVRTGLHGKVDYEFNNLHKLELYVANISLNDFETRTRNDTILKIGRGQGPGTGRIELRERSRQRYQKIYNATLQGTHKFTEKLTADWSAVYSLATNDDPDLAQLMWLTAVTRNSDGELVQDPIMYGTDYTRRWSNNTDGDIAGYGNIKYAPKLFNLPIELSTGGMYRHKDRQSNFDEYLFRASPIFQEWSGDVNDGSWTLFNSIGTPTDPLNYTCTEDVLALYGMFKVDFKKLEVMGGARYEGTAFQWISNAPVTVKGKTGSITYSDLLPSIHFKYKPTDKQNIRLSYFASISRPSFYEVIPFEINEEDFRERGNPFLQRTTADNFDFRYERFTNFLDKIMLGFFYKRLDNPIESALAIVGQSVFLQPNNFGTAQNMGIEFDFTKYIRKFGIRFFYTYTNSEITTSKIVRFRGEDGNLTSRQENQTRPLQGQSDHISNISLLYKDTKKGLNSQLSCVYTGKRIISVSPYLDNDIWQRGFVQLDFSLEKEIGKGFTAYLKINNVLNTPLRADILLPNTFNPEQAPYLDASESVLVREDFYRQIYFLGVKYRFVKN